MITPMMTHQPGTATGAGIDLHLGQNPKLGGEVRRRFTHLHIIFCRFIVYPCFAFFLLCCFLLLFLLSKTQKDQKYFRCFFLFGSLGFYLWFALLAIFGLPLEKSKNISLCSLFPFILVSKIENPKNICCSSSVS
jgi:hypothetical protein